MNESQNMSAAELLTVRHRAIQNIRKFRAILDEISPFERQEPEALLAAAAELKAVRVELESIMGRIKKHGQN